MKTQMLATISGESFVEAIIWLVAIGLIWWLLTWAVSKIGPPEPFAKIIQVVLILGAVVFLINVILTLIGHPMIKF